jgi:hypothetical protein
VVEIDRRGAKCEVEPSAPLRRQKQNAIVIRATFRMTAEGTSAPASSILMLFSGQNDIHTKGMTWR